MLCVGLTGGIASGKTTVSGFFRQAGAVVIDADEIAREVVAPGLPAWQAIKDAFGSDVCRADGTLDRDRLGEKVFNDSQLRHKLETIVHPAVKQRMDSEIKRLAQSVPHAVVILDVPLLIEAQMAQGLDEVIVVYAPQSVQLQRLMQRNALSLEAAQLRIDAQMAMEDKRRLATIIIDNSGDLAHTKQQTLSIYRNLCQRAAGNAKY